MNKITLRKRLFAIAVCVFAWVGVNAYKLDLVNKTLILENTTEASWDWGSSVPQEVKNALSSNQIEKIALGKVVNDQDSYTVDYADFSDGWSGGFLLSKDDSWKQYIKKIDLSHADFSGITANITIGSVQVAIPNTDPIEYKTKTGVTNGSVNNGKESAWAFKEFLGLETITWPPAGKISVIPSKAFQYAGIEEVTIPGYINYLGGQAFENRTPDTYLKKVVFEEYPKPLAENQESQVQMYIATQAIHQTWGLMDVYVETLGLIGAANNAFPHHQTYGHSDPNIPMANLHFPAEKAEDYVNLADPLSEAQANDDGQFQKWLADHYSKAGDAHNGFYEFVANGPLPPDDAPDMGDVVLKTFSDATMDYVVPNGVKAYIVNKIISKGDKYEVVLQKVNVIPHGTGVILYGGTNAKTSDGKKKYLSMTAVNYTGPAYTYNETVNYKWRNLLVGTAKADGSGTDLLPYELNNAQTAVAWRIFCLGRFSGTKEGKKSINNGIANYIGFFRSLPGTMKSGMAFLKVPVAEFNKPTGGEIIVPAEPWSEYSKEYTPGSGTDTYDDDGLKAKGWWYKGTSPNLSKITWTEDWGVRSSQLASFAKFSGEPIFEELDNGVATLIVPSSMVETVDTEGYYTLQGVKVNNPSKGVYIKNGKKVVLK